LVIPSSKGPSLSCRYTRGVVLSDVNGKCEGNTDLGGILLNVNATICFIFKLLPPGDNPIAVNISYHFFSQSYRASWYYQDFITQLNAQLDYSRLKLIRCPLCFYCDVLTWLQSRIKGWGLNVEGKVKAML